MRNETAKPSPFRKVLVANRGEIALRIIRTARQLGYSTVAVYSEADAGAPYLTAADEAVRIGPSPPADSYLRIDRIIEGARSTGADAIHPGYGFLAENAGLAEACVRAGIVFVGPPVEAIRAMGDKAQAKSILAEAGMPCVPGYRGEKQDDETLAREAADIGWPVMIKAIAGGGGRGMRVVEDRSSFPQALLAARSEAKAAFGDDRVMLEKAVVNPRHVEIQVAADRHGNAIHLGERDCSVQRRHQKLIEEAPSPAVSDRLREEMGAAAVRATLAIGYEGLGTLEFLLSEDGGWYFMEMNTRLQVEHPVTEMITGLDLVAMQLNIAAGAPLELRQEDIVFSGHAMEVRLCAEDPDREFMPRSGRMEIWRPAPAIRTDHALASGSQIPAYYDSMIAKLVAHGHDREAARFSLRRGLDETVALGVTTNKAFLSACLDHPAFADGSATTGFVDKYRAELKADESRADQAASLAAAILRAAPGVTLTHGFVAPVRLAHNAKRHERLVRAGPHGRCEIVAIPGEPDEIVVLAISGNEVRYIHDGVERTALVWHRNNRLLLHADGRAWEFEDRTFMPEKTAEGHGDGNIRAAMTGRVVAVSIGVGDMVSAGQDVVVLEAMKMEHAHRSQIAGKVAAVHVREGEQVSASAMLVEIEPG